MLYIKKIQTFDITIFYFDFNLSLEYFIYDEMTTTIENFTNNWRSRSSNRIMTFNLAF